MNNDNKEVNDAVSCKVVLIGPSSMTSVFINHRCWKNQHNQSLFIRRLC